VADSTVQGELGSLPRWPPTIEKTRNGACNHAGIDEIFFGIEGGQVTLREWTFVGCNETSSTGSSGEEVPLSRY